MDKARQLHFTLTFWAWLIGVFGWIALLLGPPILPTNWARTIAVALWLFSFIVLNGAVYVQLRIERAVKKIETKKPGD